MFLVIDNYDSFTYNLVQYLGEMGVDPVVCRNDAISVDEALALGPEAIVISPGPGLPADAGVCVALVRQAFERCPILGVCLGHQVIGAAFGAKIESAPRLMHGKTSLIHHDATGVFAGLPSPTEAMRYHSLVVAEASIPEELTVNAWTQDASAPL